MFDNCSRGHCVVCIQDFHRRLLGVLFESRLTTQHFLKISKFEKLKVRFLCVSDGGCEIQD